MKTVKFFNKLQNSVNLQNIAANQINNNLKSFINSFTRSGFLTGYSESDYGFTISQPTFTMGAQPVGTLNPDYLNISITNGNVFGINSNGDPLIININEMYQTLDSTQDGGNINIPLSANTKPYTNYIYIIYRQTLDKSQPAIDYDGNTNYPINNHGYYIYVSTSSTYTNSAGLYCGSVTVNADLSQTYNYSNVLITGVRDNAVKIQVPISDRTFTQSYNAGDNKTLRDHIAAIGTNSTTGGITASNPHGVSASDIGALDGSKLNSSNQFKNGFIVAPNSTGLQLPFGAQVYTSSNYVYLSEGGDGIVSNYSGFMYNGIQHYINEIVNTFQISGLNKAYISFTNSDSQGWYLIYLAPGSVLNTFQLYKISMNPGNTRPNGDSNIWLGFIYWNGSALCLNETNIASNGNYILPTISYAWIDQSSINKEPSNFDMISQNLISNDPTLYDLPDNGKYTRTSGIISTNIDTIGNVNWLQLYLSGSGSWEQFSLYTNQKLSLGTNATNFYTVSFNYIGNVNTSVKVIIGGQTYYLPSISTSGSYYFMINGFIDSINFQIKTSTANAYILLNNIQIYQGINPTLNYIEPQTYTNEIVFDSNQSKYNVSGTLQNIETRIDKINLDNILQLLPLINTQIFTSGILGTTFTNWSTNIKNLELWFIRIVAPRVDTSSTSGYYNASITFGTNFAPVSAILNRVGSIYQAGVSGDNRNSFQEFYVSNVTSSTITFNALINSTDNGAYGQFASSIALTGIMIMQKIS
jgi:hypothetical protein